ncbi:MAG: DNA replication/repair protein RecF, partial [Bacilli bacterium]
MHINKIKLYNYRNYENIEIEFDKNINIIIGKNAQGKTNLIEAIYVTSMGKSFRTSKDNELIKFNSEFCKINSEYIKYEEDGNVEVAISKDKKAIKVDGVNIKKISQLMENVLTVVFSPEDLKIVKEEPQKRRNFIDRELCQLKISYFSNLGNYKKILLQRNSYLKEKNIDENILEVWDDQLADYGSKIIIERNQFVKNLNEISKNIHKKIT